MLDFPYSAPRHGITLERRQDTRREHMLESLLLWEKGSYFALAQNDDVDEKKSYTLLTHTKRTFFLFPQHTTSPLEDFTTQQ